MRNLLHRFLDIRKLAALILAAAIAAVAVVSLTAPPARAGHDTFLYEQKRIAFVYGCRDMEAVVTLAALPPGKAWDTTWNELVKTDRCFAPGRPVNGIFEAVMTELDWAPYTTVVVVEVHSVRGDKMFVWISAAGWKSLGIEPTGLRV